MRKRMEKDFYRKEHEIHYDAADNNDRLIINFRDINHIMRFLYEGRGSQKRILIILLETGVITQRKLTERLGIQPGSASEVLAKLEKSGLIVRTESQTDHRTTDITLTEQGKILAEEAAVQRKTRHEEMFSCLTEEEKGRLLALLEKVNGDWQERYHAMEDASCGRHGHDRPHEPFHESGRDKVGKCEGNCQECTHPCGHGRNNKEFHDGRSEGGFHHRKGRR